MTTNESQPELPEEQFAPEEEEERPELQIAPKDRKLVTHPYDFIVRSLKDQIDDKTLVLADKFQRRRVWEDRKSSRLIESLLLNVPIPVCYFAEIDNGCYSVIDGQQRLTAMYRYINNEFTLRGLKVRPDLNGKRYHQLDDQERRLIGSRSIRCIVILKESHPEIRFDVFERLNTGAVKLNAQELRNSVYRGALNDLIRQLSEYKPFQRARAATDIDKRMQDCELILRFFAFHYRLSAYRGLLAPFLDAYLKDGASFDAATLDAHRAVFTGTIDLVFSVFGASAFRKHAKPHGWEKTVNRAIFDAVMLVFAASPHDQIQARAQQVVGALADICDDQAFVDAITFATKDRKKLQVRIDKLRDALVSLGVAVPQLTVGTPA